MSDTETRTPDDEPVVVAIDESPDDTTADSAEEAKPSLPEVLNVLPLRESVVFPMLIAPLSVSRPASVQLIDDSVVSSDRVIGVVAQRNPDTDEPGFDDIYGVGCAVIVRTLMKSSDATRLIVQGTSRFRIVEVVQTTPYLKARIEPVSEPTVPEEEAEEVEALRRTVAALFEHAVRLSPAIPDELRQLTENVHEANVMADLVAAHLPFSVVDKQNVLESVDLKERMHKLLHMLSREVRILELTSKVQHEVSAELSKTQRDYYLREQLKAIQRELGESDGPGAEVDDLAIQVEESGMPEEAMASANRELDRLRRINPGSPEYTVARTYLETMLAVPWQTSTTDNLDLKHARAVLDADHFGLEKIKRRIIEFLAVRKVKEGGAVRQPILCFYGPPGVGKTSLGRSIARALGREFYRMSLGGVRDEAEVRGHRRTYIGAMPGQIVQGLRRVGTNNPVFLLDEIDKLGNDFRGDPSSALLEVLDPHQNSEFRDHYLDVPLDLSNVLFLTTANRLDTIPHALRDRMEIIELGGYTEEEKLEIAKRHLVPRQVEEHGLAVGKRRRAKVRFEDDALSEVIRGYTREAGVRNLDREVAGVVRHATLKFAEGRKSALTVDKAFVHAALGAPRFTHDEVAERDLVPGVAVGLAWTPVGGDVLFIESVRTPGKGHMTVTGQLGDVMKESVSAAMTYLKAHAAEYSLTEEDFDKWDVHIHVPAGATPKDGPSAGITMLTALASLFTGRRVKQRLAMTGEVTLTGQVLPIGGVKEKVLAAFRAGVTTLLLPDDNRKDYAEDVADDVRRKLKVHFVKDASKVLELALRR
ncbi:MAG: endopeptidase La [Fimbriimonadaceae bacterium]|nr:endopeptidase La [Fimbriimonadaceae bacterium]